jgi:hypothetical protein
VRRFEMRVIGVNVPIDLEHSDVRWIILRRDGLKVSTPSSSLIAASI